MFASTSKVTAIKKSRKDSNINEKYDYYQTETETSGRATRKSAIIFTIKISLNNQNPTHQFH